MARKTFKEGHSIPYHPSYGYATPEQIEKLNSLKNGMEYKQLLKIIQQQNEDKGKVRL